MEKCHFIVVQLGCVSLVVTIAVRSNGPVAGSWCRAKAHHKMPLPKERTASARIEDILFGLVDFLRTCAARALRAVKDSESVQV